jgi:hypothetical protein
MTGQETNMPLIDLTFIQTGTSVIRREPEFPMQGLPPSAWFWARSFALALTETSIKIFMEKHFLDRSD